MSNSRYSLPCSDPNRYFPNGKTVPEWFFTDPQTRELKRYIVTDHGVLPGRDSLLQTDAIQRVIDLAAAEGGGLIVFPAGSYYSGSLFFKPGTALHLEKDALLLGSREICDFALLPTRMEGENVNYFAALINADQVDGFSISGEGTIDGCGLDYWRHFWLRRKFNPNCTNMDEMRPRLIYISNSSNVWLHGVKLRNSPFWTCHFYRCNKLRITDLEITAPARPIPSPSTDAIDLDVCKEVLIKGCYFSVNDDAVALKGGKGPQADTAAENGGNEDVIIDSCRFGKDCHCVLTCGSETIYNCNIILQNSRIDGARLFYLKMRPDTTQMSEYITLRNLTGSSLLLFLSASWTQFRRCPELYISGGRNIVFENLNMQCKRICQADASNEYTLENIRFSNCNITSAEPLKIDFEEGKAFDFSTSNIEINCKVDF